MRTLDTAQVQDGILANRRISRFNQTAYNRTAYIYNGSLATGLLRGPLNPLANPNLTRYPADNAFVDIAVASPALLKLAVRRRVKGSRELREATRSLTQRVVKE